jgi:hypothetical protein
MAEKSAKKSVTDDSVYKSLTHTRPHPETKAPTLNRGSRPIQGVTPAITSMSYIFAAISELRNIVNAPRLQQVLMRSQTTWHKLCSAMDTIEDTGMAVRAYSSGEDTRDKGLLYLQTYGVLQALVVQQDATSDLCNALGSPRAKGDFPGLASVRAVRVSAVGHPTKPQHKSGEGPHYMVQMSLGRGGFELVSFSSGSPKFKRVNMCDRIREQEDELGKILKGVIDDLKSDDAKHKAQFQGNKLEAAFPNTLSFSFGKINEHIRGETLVPMGAWGIEQVRKAVDDFRSGIEARSFHVGTCDSAEYIREQIEYPLGQLEQYLHGKESEVLNPRAASIFSFFIEKQVEKLRMIATEIDKDFGS